MVLASKRSQTLTIKILTNAFLAVSSAGTQHMNFMGGPDLTGHHPGRRMRQAELVRHDADKRRIMRTIRDTSLISVATAAVLTLVMAMPSASAQEFPGGEQDIFGMSIPEAMPVAPPPMDVPDMGDGTTAADAALGMANLLDGAGGGVSSGDLMAALENAADAFIGWFNAVYGNGRIRSSALFVRSSHSNV